MATLPTGTLTPSQTQQTSSKKAVSLIDSLLNTPTLAQGTSVTPTLQNVQTNELMATPGVTVVPVGAVGAVSNVSITDITLRLLSCSVIVG